MIELAGVALAGIDSVSAAPGPALINRDPAPLETNVPRGARIALEVSVPNGDAVDGWSVRVWINGALAVDGSAPSPLSAPYAGPGAGVSVVGLSYRVVLSSTDPLPSAANVSVRVVASSSKGMLRIDETYAFTVEDVSPPVLVSATSTGPRTAQLVFNKAVVLPPSALFALVPTTTPAVHGSVVQAIPSGAIVDLMLAWPLSPGVVYTATVIGVVDTYGHLLEAPGSEATCSAYAPPKPPMRKFDLWSMIPKMNRRADTSGDLAAFIGCIQEVTGWLLADIDALFDLLDIERAPEWMLDRILADLGNPFTFDLSELQKRRLAAILMEIYQLVGTAPGIQAAVRFFVGLEDIAITPLTATTIVLGESELGVDWELGPGLRFDRYAFQVVVPRVLTDTERAAVQALVSYMRPSHTHFISLQEPSVPTQVDAWVIGVSELGVTSVLS